MSKSDTITSEQFWVTATTIGFNFVVIDNVVEKNYCGYILPYIILINIYAVYLILHRAASYSSRLAPEIPKSERMKTCSDKLHETKNNIIAAIKMIPMVVVELSGSLFYILLILGSFFGILLQIFAK